MDSMNENVIEFLRDEKTATVTFCQGRFITKIRKLTERFPDDVIITHENNDGSIVAHVPTRWIRINPPKEMSDEYKEQLAERGRNNLLALRATNTVDEKG